MICGSSSWTKSTPRVVQLVGLQKIGKCPFERGWKSCKISWTRRLNSVNFWYRRVSSRAKVPARERWDFWTVPVNLLKTYMVGSCFREALQLPLGRFVWLESWSTEWSSRDPLSLSTALVEDFPAVGKVSRRFPHLVSPFSASQLNTDIGFNRATRPNFNRRVRKKNSSKKC